VIIDSHTHIFSPDVVRNRDNYCSSDQCFGLLYSSPKAELLCAEDLIRSMDECGISKSAVLNIGWESHALCVRTNDYILESVARFPDRLIGFCSVQPKDSKGALAELDRCHRAGAKGLGELRPDTQGYDLRDGRLMSPLVKKAIEKGMILVLHASEPVGHAYPGKGRMTPDILYDFAGQHRELKLIFAHFGGGLPFYELMPEVSTALSNVYYDTAAAPYLYSADVYAALLKTIVSGRLLFGSDWPLLNQIKVMDHIKSARLDQAYLANILGLNAEKLFL
jgi:predicted TIM-barrel fold metal-dependent hydrolase